MLQYLVVRRGPLFAFKMVACSATGGVESSPAGGSGPIQVPWSVSGLDKESDEQQVSTLLYCLGDTTDDIHNSTNISEDAGKKYSKVLAKFDEFFKAIKSFIFEQPSSTGATSYLANQSRTTSLRSTIWSIPARSMAS